MAGAGACIRWIALGTGRVLLGLPLLLLLVDPVLAEDPPPEDETPTPAEAVVGEPVKEEVERTEAPKKESKEQLKHEIDGYLRAEFRFRGVGSDNDLDFYGDLYANYTHRGEHVIRARVNARLNWDLSGDSLPNEPLYDLWDIFNGDAQIRVWEAWVEWDRAEGEMLKVRGGRMFLEEGVWLQFDGGQLDMAVHDLVEGMDFSALVGVPVLFGEQSRSNDWLAGIVVRHRVSPRTRWRFEYYHVSQFFDGVNDPLVDPVNQPVVIPADRVEDDYFGFSLWQILDSQWRFYGRFTILESDANELHLRLKWNSKDGKWLVVGEWFQLFNRLFNVTDQLSPYVPMMGVFQPFFRFSLRGTCNLDEHWLLRAGYSRRQLEDSADEGVFNHSYDNYFASATYLGLVEGTLDLTFLLNGFNASGNDAFTVAGLAADWRVDSKWTVSGGIDYNLFKYDFLSNTEHENVWSYWVDARFRLSREWDFRGRLVVDDDEFDTYITFWLNATMRF